jgi:hypothetical protein
VERLSELLGMIDPHEERNIEGETTAITVFSTLKTWGRAWLPVLFVIVRRFPRFTRTLRELSFIHFARWAIVRELPYNGPPQRKGPLRFAHLYFESNFNGSWREYILAFSHKLTRGMLAFWGSSYGFPGAMPTEPFMQYIRANETGDEADHYYSAYPGATTTMIQRALTLAGHSPPPPTVQSPNVSGQVYAFMAMTPVKPREQAALTAYLRGLDLSPLVKLPRTHIARFVVVEDFHNDPSWKQPAEEHLDVPYLIFTAYLDGDLDSYLDELAALPEAEQIWGRCVGFAGSHLQDYLKHNQINTGLFFAAYDATVPQVLAALERLPPDEVPEWASKTPGVRINVGRAVQIVMDTYERERRPGLAKRDQHAEEYGTIHGRLTVHTQDVPADLRRGLFARDGSYDVTCRLSPNAATPWPLCPPVGLALKVHGPVEQDFLTGAKTDRFFCKNAADAVDLVKARAAGLPGLARYFFPSVNPKRWRLLELQIMAQTLAQRVPDLLADTTYFSQIAISCGSELTVKYAVQTPPSTGRRRPSLRRPDPAARLREQLAEAGVTVGLALQRMDADDDPNDPRQSSTGAWEEVATIFFPAQEVGNGEHLIMTLAHCLPEHQPCGEICEVRVAVYEAIAKRRRQLNTLSAATLGAR